MSSPADTLQRRPRSRAAISASGDRIARLDNHSATRRVAMRSVPQVLKGRFVPGAATGLNTTYELRVLAPDCGGEERFALVVANGELTVERRAAPEATAWVAVSLGDMIRLVAGSAGPWQLMAAKRLEVGGDVFTAMRFPPLLGL